MRIFFAMNSAIHTLLTIVVIFSLSSPALSGDEATIVAFADPNTAPRPARKANSPHIRTSTGQQLPHNATGFDQRATLKGIKKGLLRRISG